MTATGVGPKSWPERFVRAPLLQQYLASVVKQKDGESPVQGARALV